MNEINLLTQTLSILRKDTEQSLADLRKDMHSMADQIEAALNEIHTALTGITRASKMSMEVLSERIRILEQKISTQVPGEYPDKVDSSSGKEL